MRIPEEKTLFASDAKSAWIRQTYPVGCQSIYTAFGNGEASQHDCWRPFVGQGAILEGEYCVVKSANHQTKTAIVKTQHETRTVLFSSLTAIPKLGAKAEKQNCKWLVCWKPRAQMREEYGYISLPPYMGVGSIQPEQRPEVL